MKQKIKTLAKKIRNTLDRAGKDSSVRTIAVCAAHVPFFKGGAEAHVNALILELKERGYEVELINIPYKWYPHEQLQKSIEIWKLLDLSESNGKKIDMVIATKFPSYFVNHPNKTLWLIHQYRQIYDLFHTTHSGFDPGNKKHIRLRQKLIEDDQKALKSYKRIYTNSKNTAARLRKYNRISGIPLYHPPQLAGRYFTSDFQDYILSVGRLDKLKRVDLLLKAIKGCGSRVKCKIVGTGPELENLQSLAREWGILDRVEFLGFVSDDELLHLYAHCSVVFFAPLDEDYGYITLESFLSKKPVVTGFDSGGPLEFVEDGVNGLILKSFEEKYMSQRIEELFTDKKRCEALGSQGFLKVNAINWDDVISTLLYGKKQ